MNKVGYIFGGIFGAIALLVLSAYLIYLYINSSNITPPIGDVGISPSNPYCNRSMYFAN